MIDDRIRLQFEVQEFLFLEAELLDRQAYAEWLELLDEDVVYWAPVVESVEFRNRSANRVADSGEMALFEETKATLKMRVARLSFPGAWAEAPPSRTRHFISNVIARSGSDGSISARSNFHIFRSRLEREEDNYYGSREDQFTRRDGVLRLVSRKIIVAQAVLTARSVTTFF